MTKEEKPHRKSFLSEEEKAERIKQAALSQGGQPKKEVKVLQPEIALMLILGEITKCRQFLQELCGIFKNVTKASEAKTDAKPEVTKEVEEVPIPASPESPTPARASERVLQIREAFKPLDDIVTLEEAKSAMFVLVKPKGYLGADKFAKVGEVSKSLGGDYVSQGKASHFRIPKQTKPPTQTPATQTQTEAVPKANKGVEDIKMMFPEDLENLLNFTDKGDHIRIKPRQFLGSDNFAKIASIVRGVGGDYVSAGKDSHFRVQK